MLIFLLHLVQDFLWHLLSSVKQGKNELIAQYICIIMVYLKQQIMSFKNISARTEQLSKTFH